MTDEFTNESADAPVEETAEATPTEPRFDNVRAYRHAATGALARGRETLAFRTPETGEIYSKINGVISRILEGRSGLSVEEQVAHLDDALTKVTEAKESLPELIAAAKASVLAALDNMEETIMAEVQNAHSVLREGKEYAATRDFEAHQARKHASGGYAYLSDPEASHESGDLADDEEETSGW